MLVKTKEKKIKGKTKMIKDIVVRKQLTSQSWKVNHYALWLLESTSILYKHISYSHFFKHNVS